MENHTYVLMTVLALEEINEHYEQIALLSKKVYKRENILVSSALISSASIHH